MAAYQSESRYTLRMQLANIEPPIWRRVIVPGAVSLHTLHKMLQVVMGWENSHLYLYRLNVYQKPAVYGLPDPEWGSEGNRIKDSRRTKLDATVWAERLQLTYEYDLGDSWIHTVTVEHIEHIGADEHRPVFAEDLWFVPRCLAGERACPPEDAGGAEGYAHFLEAWHHPGHPEHERMHQWAGEHYDPELFSIQQANSALANLE